MRMMLGANIPLCVWNILFCLPSSLAKIRAQNGILS